ncbi:MAG: hypothetical protein ACSHYA_12370 [Opitutaceae bacterium]
MKILYWTLTTLAAVSSLSAIESIDQQLDRLKDALIYETTDGWFYIEAGAQFDLTGMYSENQDGNPPGFFFPDVGERYDFSPRLTLTLDAFAGDHLYGFLKFRADDGVHPGAGQYYGSEQEYRVDELFVRGTFLDGALNIQAGQFVPILGNFLNRQDNWDMGLVSAPMLYEQVTSISDFFVPASAASFAGRRNASDFPRKLFWIPAYWAQLYTRGVSAFGTHEQWDYALNFTNRAPSSRGVTWNDNDWSNSSWMGNIGYQINPAWRVGLTGTIGAYLQDAAEAALPGGNDVGDYLQRNIGIDLTYKKGKYELWAELVHTSFEVPNVGEDAEFWSYFIEGRYNFDPRWWVSARWNHQIYEDIEGMEWDNEHQRIDLGIGHRFGRHSQIKLQYSHQDEDSEVDLNNAEHFFVIEASLRL